jgi:hypothetical protein
MVVGCPDEQVSYLADRMVAADVGRVPIVDRATARLVGLVIAQGPASHPSHGKLGREEPRGFSCSASAGFYRVMFAILFSST